MSRRLHLFERWMVCLMAAMTFAGGTMHTFFGELKGLGALALLGVFLAIGLLAAHAVFRDAERTARIMRTPAGTGDEQ